MKSKIMWACGDESCGNKCAFTDSNIQSCASDVVKGVFYPTAEARAIEGVVRAAKAVHNGEVFAVGKLAGTLDKLDRVRKGKK